MSRPPICDVLDRDLACAIALGLVEHPRVVANLHAVTVHDPAMRPLGTCEGWLGDDPLEVATRAYLEARRDALMAGSPLTHNGAWAARVAQSRDEANARAQAAKVQARALLEERGVAALARRLGMSVLG